MKRPLSSFICISFLVGAVPALAAPSMCIAEACLGMTVQDSAKLPLLEVPSHLKMAFKSDSLQGHGLDNQGRRVWIGIGNFERRSIQEYVQRVHTTCAVEHKTAWLQSSDGNKIFVRFTPAMVQGRGTLVVTQITRVLGPSLSDAQYAALMDQARKRYGAAFSEQPVRVATRPTAWLDFGFSHGRVLELAMPVVDQKQAMLSQPGCGTPPSLD